MTNDKWVNFVSLGARACLKLKQFEEAMIWCEKGLAVSFLRSIHAASSHNYHFLYFWHFTINFFLAFSKLEVESIKVIKNDDLSVTSINGLH